MEPNFPRWEGRRGLDNLIIEGNNCNRNDCSLCVGNAAHAEQLRSRYLSGGPFWLLFGQTKSGIRQ